MKLVPMCARVSPRLARSIKQVAEHQGTTSSTLIRTILYGAILEGASVEKPENEYRCVCGKTLIVAYEIVGDARTIVKIHPCDHCMRSVIATVREVRASVETLTVDS
jgi:hypothetical protein